MKKNKVLPLNKRPECRSQWEGGFIKGREEEEESEARDFQSRAKLDFHPSEHLEWSSELEIHHT